LGFATPPHDGFALLAAHKDALACKQILDTCYERIILRISVPRNGTRRNLSTQMRYLRVVVSYTLFPEAIHPPTRGQSCQRMRVLPYQYASRSLLRTNLAIRGMRSKMVFPPSDPVQITQVRSGGGRLIHRSSPKSPSARSQQLDLHQIHCRFRVTSAGDYKTHRGEVPHFSQQGRC